MTELPDVPAIVAQLAAKIGMPPMKWRVTETQVVIIFENGQKMTFDRVEPVKAGPDEPLKPIAPKRNRKA